MENVKILCDTDVIIEYLKGNETTKKIFDKLESANIALSAITLSGRAIRPPLSLGVCPGASFYHLQKLFPCLPFL